jgi:ADP-heptose:LPS heptosyltransferase
MLVLTQKTAPPHILFIRFKSIGDVIFTLPAVCQVRASFPDAKIVFLTSRENAALLRGFRAVDEIIAVDRDLYRRGNPWKIFCATAGLVRRLRRENFSLAIDLQGYVETAILTWCSGAPQRWGSVYNRGRRWAYTQGVTRDYGLHPVDWNLFLLRKCGLAPNPIREEFILPDDVMQSARDFFKANQLLPGRRTLFIQPFTSSPGKNWPLEGYLSVAKFWREHGLQVLFGGGPGESDALEPARAEGFPVSAGAPLLLSAGLMKLSTLVLGGDTGMPHLALALGKRVIVIMQSNRPGNCFPFQHPDWTVTPDEHQPVSGITTAAVNAACAKAWAEPEMAFAFAGGK